MDREKESHNNLTHNNSHNKYKSKYKYNYLSLLLVYTQPFISPLNQKKKKMDATLSVRPNRFTSGSPYPRPTSRKPGPPPHISRRRHTTTTTKRNQPWPWPGPFSSTRRTFIAAPPVLQAGSRADDSAPFEMSVENALKLLGVSDGASFDDILRAKNSVLASCKDDQDAIAQVLFSF